jgi:hypothetical protein
VMDRFATRHYSRGASYILDVAALKDSRGTFSATGGAYKLVERQAVKGNRRAPKSAAVHCSG